MAEQRRRILLNFKNTEEEIALYEFIKAKSSQSGYIKDILKDKLDQELTSATSTTQVENQQVSEVKSKKNSIQTLL